MDQGLHSKTYLAPPRNKRGWVSVVVSLMGLVAVGLAVTQASGLEQLLDGRSILIVGIGTLATTLLQYDLRSLISALASVSRSFVGTPDRSTSDMQREIDDAIMRNEHLATLRDGERVTGELLNDVVYMHHQGLLFDEINQFVLARLETEYARRRVAADLLRRAALTAPALGLLGTVVGLMGVLRAMDDPSQIGPLMSLALMTTAYGAGLGSLVFTPLAGRLEHHNMIYAESHRQLLSRVGILLSREERQFQTTHVPRILSDEPSSS